MDKFSTEEVSHILNALNRHRRANYDLISYDETGHCLDGDRDLNILCGELDDLSIKILNLLRSEGND